MAKHLLTVFFLICSTSVGCSSSPPSSFTPSAEYIEHRKRLDANEAYAKTLLESGEVYAGQSLEEFLRLCTPYRFDFVDRFAFIEFDSVPNLTGLSLVVVDGKLASATEWSCVHRHEYFNTMSAADKQASLDAYEYRLYGDR